MPFILIHISLTAFLNVDTYWIAALPLHVFFDVNRIWTISALIFDRYYFFKMNHFTFWNRWFQKPFLIVAINKFVFGGIAIVNWLQKYTLLLTLRMTGGYYVNSFSTQTYNVQPSNTDIHTTTSVVHSILPHNKSTNNSWKQDSQIVVHAYSVARFMLRTVYWGYSSKLYLVSHAIWNCKKE